MFQYQKRTLIVRSLQQQYHFTSIIVGVQHWARQEMSDQFGIYSPKSLEFGGVQMIGLGPLLHFPSVRFLICHVQTV